MKAYLYDADTKEFLYEEELDADPVATKRTGEWTPLIPANSTLIAPPKKVKANHIPIFENNKWVQVLDYRGRYVISEDFDISFVDYLGELEDGYVLATEEEIEMIQKDPYYYIWSSKGLKINPNYSKDVKNKEKETRKKEILKELEAIDMKSIRAIRTGDTAYLTKYEEEAQKLRDELKSL